MVYLRSLLFFIWMVLTTLSFAIFFIVAGRFIRYEKLCSIAAVWSRINLKSLKLLCGLDYQLNNWTAWPPQTYIYLSKHQSAWETIAFRSLLPHTQIWVLKKELMSVPFFGNALKRFRVIAIDRSSGRRAVKQIVEQGTAELDAGHCVIIFPEGTRVAPGERKRYGVGSALLAAKSGYPVIPIAHNAGVFWGRRGLKKYPGVIQLVMGEPIATKGRKADAILKDVENWIEEQQEKLPQSRD
ncbi:MAG: 1-acyl-sn-glycerol-3-phosphate acyltransferase [gamma proteobacterium symbiont of Bathyaustriella thionipta]|nr:1-acyl-sn-glycerol-3-phosphate acyltransferase [gamma proteobacterium symbiont of Bathyaustriella thionipta]